MILEIIRFFFHRYCKHDWEYLGKTKNYFTYDLYKCKKCQKKDMRMFGISIIK